MKSLKFLFVLISTTFLFGCAPTRQHHELATSARGAKVYVIRPSLFAYVHASKIYANEKYVGKLGPKNAIFLNTSASKLVLTSQMENKSEIELDLEQGKVYYVKQKVKMGYFVKPRTQLELLSQEEGERLLAKVQPKKKTL